MRGKMKTSGSEVDLKKVKRNAENGNRGKQRTVYRNGK
jgi:hypothetical protein